MSVQISNVTLCLFVCFLLILSLYKYLYDPIKRDHYNLDDTHNETIENNLSAAVRRRSPIQSRRLNLVKNVCESYRGNPHFNRVYVQNPGKNIRGKFTFEPKSKLVMCNVMKQGKLNFSTNDEH